MVFFQLFFSLIFPLFKVVRDENYLNILRQICLFIPEWCPFAQQALLGGQQRGQTLDLLNNQQQSTTSKTTLNFVPTDTTTPCSVSLMDFRMLMKLNKAEAVQNIPAFALLEISNNLK
uniref:Uncharacterized protein n=1 Tax=Meloidogyne floridensis TaxID=298350 RepID=A0A915PC96_9BILA